MPKFITSCYSINVELLDLGIVIQQLFSEADVGWVDRCIYKFNVGKKLYHIFLNISQQESDEMVQGLCRSNIEA